MTIKHTCYSAINKRPTILGVPVTAAIVFFTVSMVLFLALKTVLVPIISIILYGIVAFLYTLDPFFLEIIVPHLKTKNFYNP